MPLLKRLVHFFSAPALQAEAAHVYISLIEQSRKPFFYEQLSVPDTLDGRFEMVALHLFLVLNRLKQDESEDAAAFIRALTEAHFADLDRAIREEGIGDAGVKKRVRNMAAHVFGRLQAYEQALEGKHSLTETLQRNVYATMENPPAKAVEQMAFYVKSCVAMLAKQHALDVRAAQIPFAPLS